MGTSLHVPTSLDSSGREASGEGKLQYGGGIETRRIFSKSHEFTVLSLKKDEVIEEEGSLRHILMEGIQDVLFDIKKSANNRSVKS